MSSIEMTITRKFKRYNRYLFKHNPHLFICIDIEDDKENNDNEDKESEYVPSEDPGSKHKSF